MLFFGTLDFSQRKETNTLRKTLGENDYVRFEAELTSKLQTSVSAGVTCKRVLSHVEKAANKKKVLKDEE
jgi:hypothetical protein